MSADFRRGTLCVAVYDTAFTPAQVPSRWLVEESDKVIGRAMQQQQQPGRGGGARSLVLVLFVTLVAAAAGAPSAPGPRPPAASHSIGLMPAPYSSAGAPAAHDVHETPVAFHGHKVLRLVPTTEKQVQDLRQYRSHEHHQLDFWLEPTAPGRPVDVHVGPNDTAVFKEAVTRMGLSAREMIADLGRLIDDEQRQMLDTKRSNPDFGWESYHNLEEIYRWLQSLAQKYPSEVTLVEAGRTFEERKIVGVKIKFGEADLPVAFLEAGIHAREWITPATATYFINEILTRDDEDFRNVTRAYEWHIFPSTNPDGYVFTHSGNRMWRKSRSRYSYICQGADLNRNWPFHWKEVGSSSIPCSDVYAGVKAESESETKAMRRYLDALMDRANPVRVYISLHSYSQLLMFPWGYTSEPTKMHDELNAIAGAAVEAATKRHGTKFRYGAIATTIYPASGSTLDYAHEKGVKYPFVFELRDEGQYGFLLPADQIRPAAEETVDAIEVIVGEALKRK